MRQETNIAAVSLTRDLDVTTVADTRRRIDELIDSGCRRIIINMADVSFVDSAGMGLVIGEIARMRQLGGLISMVNVTPMVMRALTRARVVDFAPVSTSESRQDVSELDPRVQPLWHRVLRVDPQDLARARSRMQALLSQLSLSEDELFDATLAVGEAVGNAVDHTNGSGVLVSVAAYPDRVVVEVSDCGEGFDDCEGEFVETDEWCPRGRGIRLMRLLADSVTIGRKPCGTGTVVRIVKLSRQAL